MTNAVTCLAPETIAAYLDRRLDPAERTRVEEHLADCGECRTLLSETAAFLDAEGAAKPAPLARVSRRPWIWSAAAAAAAVLALTPFVLRQMRPTPESALRDLDRALGGKRYIEARLSGFEYGEYVAPKRGPRDPELPPAVLGAAGHVQELAAKTDSSDDLAALGASQLAIGRFDDAIQNLEEAALLAPKSARIQSDLAAAYLTRFRATGPAEHPEDPAKAVEAAATAVALDPESRAAAFNRALALEMLPLRGEAQRAWEAYLALDPSSRWGGEARARIEELKRPLPPPPPSPSAKLDELESDVFPAWGSAVLTSRDADANAALSRARTLASEIEELDGDRLAKDTLAAIDAAPLPWLTSLARAHVLVGDGRRAYLDGRFPDSDRAFADAYDIFRDGRSPYAAWVRMRSSASRFQVGDTAGAWARLDLAPGGRGLTSPTVLARMYRMRGLLRGRSGELAGTLNEYHEALERLPSDGSGDDAVALRFLVAECMDLLGERSTAWRELRRGLYASIHIRDARQRQYRLLESAILSFRQDRPRLGLHVMAELLGDHGPIAARTRAESLLHRARMHLVLNEPTLAEQDLRASEEEARAAGSGPTPRLMAEISSARADLLTQSSPAQAVPLWSEVIEFFERDRAEWRLAASFLARSRAYARMGDLPAADADLRHGLGLVEAHRQPIPDPDLQISFYARYGELMDDRLRVALAQDAGAEATFRIAERRRGRSLAAGRDLDAVSLRLPVNSVLLSYAALDDQLIIWKTTESAGTTSWIESVSSADLKRLIAHARRELRVVEGRQSLERLYDVLIRRAVADDNGHMLIVVPDGLLNGVPFNALRDRQTGRFLIEQRPLVVSPSAGMVGTGPTVTAGEKVLLVGVSRAPTPDLRSIPDVETEARDIAALYRSVVVATGASATKTWFLLHAGKASIVHFAGHAGASARSESLSRIFLAPTSGSPGSESLFASEVAARTFPETRIVVLAACSTGEGPLYAGEGPLSMARAFLAAGVPTVVASLWDVDDLSTRQLLFHFHSSLARGEPAARALRSAQLWMLQNTSAGKPADWAAFEVFGKG